MGCRVLICDDNDDDVMLLTRALADEGLDVELVRARDGEECLNQFDQSSALDLLVMDDHLPRRTGREVLEILRRRDQFPSCPVVVFTSKSGPQPWDNGVRLVLEKPFSLDGYSRIGRVIADLCAKPPINNAPRPQN